MDVVEWKLTIIQGNVEMIPHKVWGRFWRLQATPADARIAWEATIRALLAYQPTWFADFMHDVVFDKAANHVMSPDRLDTYYSYAISPPASPVSMSYVLRCWGWLWFRVDMERVTPATSDPLDASAVVAQFFSHRPDPSDDVQCNLLEATLG